MNVLPSEEFVRRAKIVGTPHLTPIHHAMMDRIFENSQFMNVFSYEDVMSAFLNTPVIVESDAIPWDLNKCQLAVRRVLEGLLLVGMIRVEITNKPMYSLIWTA